MNLLDILAGHGYDSTTDKYREHIKTWASWYKGKVGSFHDYTITNGENTIRCERARLNMAKRGCEFWADLLWNSESYVVVQGDNVDEIQKSLGDTLRDNNFLKRFNQSIEESFALGTGAAIIYEDNKKPKIDFVKSNYIYPLRTINGEIVDCAFVGYYNEPISGVTLETGDSVLQVMVHTKNINGWEIINEFYKKNKNNSTLVKIENPKVSAAYSSKTKRYSIITPNIKNNLAEVPFGISIFANCIDTLKNIDLAYDGIQVSMKIGRPRIAVDGSTIKIKDGKQKPVFDTNDMAFYMLGDQIDNGTSDKRLIQDITTQYRAGDFEQSLQAQLVTYSQAIGLGESSFRWDKGNMITAREVLSRDAAMTRSMRKHQDGLKGSIVNICKAVLDILKKSFDVEIDVHFDDSITRNKEAEELKAWQWVVFGVYPFWKYLVEYEGYTEEDAKSLSGEASKNNEENL